MEEECKDTEQVEDGENRRMSLRKRRVSQVQQEEVKTAKGFKKRKTGEDDVKNIYLNKNYKEIKPQALETIFEMSKKVRNTEVWMSTMKYKRFCKFASYHAVPKDKMKQRKDKAKRMKNQFGTKIPSGKISQDLLIDILNSISDEENDPDVKSRLKIQEKKENFPTPYKDKESQPDTIGMELVINNLCSLNMESPNRDYLEEKVLFGEEDATSENVPRKARKGRRRSGCIKDHLDIELFRSENRLEKMRERELSSFHEMPKISKITSNTSELSDLIPREPEPVLESPSKLPMFITHSNKKKNTKNQIQQHKRGKRRVSGIQRQLYHSTFFDSPESSPVNSQSSSSLRDTVSVSKSPPTAPVSPSRLLATLSINSPKQGAVTISTVEEEDVSSVPCLQPDLPHLPSHVPGPVPEPSLAVPQGRPAENTSQVQLTPKTGKSRVKGVQRRRRSDIHNINVIKENCMKEEQQPLPVTLHQHGRGGSDTYIPESNVAGPLCRLAGDIHQSQEITSKAEPERRKTQRRWQSDNHDTRKTCMTEQQQDLPHVHQHGAEVSYTPECVQKATVPIGGVNVEKGRNFQVLTSNSSSKDQTKKGMVLISDLKDDDTSPIISGMFHNKASIRKGKVYVHVPAVSLPCVKNLKANASIKSSEC
ncbi:uncharacterized protein LOC143041004 isoform X2 [Oratosquilla oratoria]